MRQGWLMAGISAMLLAAPIAAPARKAAPPRSPAKLLAVDYTLPTATHGDSRRWLLPEIAEPGTSQPKPMLRIRGTKVKMWVPI